MSAGITVPQVPDLITTTLPKLPKGVWTDTYLYQGYPFLSRIANSGARKETGGVRYEERIRLRENGSARGVDLFEVTPNFSVPVMDSMGVDWVNTEAKVNYEARAVQMNADSGAQIVKYMAGQRAGGVESLANLWETWGFLAPLSASDRKNGLNGLPFWISPLAAGVTDGAFGFNGVAAPYRDGTTTNSPGGIDASNPLNSRWRNGNAIKRGMTPQTIDLMRVGLRRVRFTGPVTMDGKGNTPARSNVCFYCSMSEADEYDRIRNQGSDPRDGQAAPFYNERLLVHGIPLQASPVLDTISYLPIFFVNHAHLFAISLTGYWMKHHPAMNSREQPNVYTEQIDCTGNIMCNNRRAHFVLHDPR